jgi:hypothetical protein
MPQWKAGSVTNAKSQTSVIVAIVGLCFALTAALPTNASAPDSVETPQVLESVSEIRFSVLGTRNAGEIFWRIDSNGKGELISPSITGYEPLVRLATDNPYHIKPGRHEFDLGKEGYSALRAFLAPIIDGKLDPGSSFTSALTCSNSTDVGAVELAWTERRKRNLMLPNECLNGLGAMYLTRIVQSWYLIADRMYAKGSQAISIIERNEIFPPKRLSFAQQDIWTQNVVKWEIDGKGKGWIELQQDTSFPTLDLLQPSYLGAGKYYFQLDPRFHQAILRELDTYLNESAALSSCDEELDMSDQPVVEIFWLNSHNVQKNYSSDLGCPSFAKDVGKIDLMFGELLKNGNLRESKLLFGKRGKFNGGRSEELND